MGSERRSFHGVPGAADEGGGKLWGTSAATDEVFARFSFSRTASIVGSNSKADSHALSAPPTSPA